MRTVFHLESQPVCPHLPKPEAPMTAAAMKAFGKERGAAFYEGALKCGHSLWLQALPAQALLQLNRGMGADLTGQEPVLNDWPMPYLAVAWIMRERTGEQFIGNPRRHYQHYATRMNEPRRAQRSWRAWACWYLARLVFPDYPADEKQLSEEGITEPGRDEIQEKLEIFGIPGEPEAWKEALEFLS